MKIAILTSGVLPVPAVQGGAVENLIDFYLEYNQQHSLHEIHIYSVAHPKVKGHKALKSAVNHYHYIDTSSTIARICKRYYRWLHGDNDYYHYSVEYFLSRVLKQIKKNNFDAILIENRPGYVLQLVGKTDATIIVHQENDYLNNQVRSYQNIYNGCSFIINTSEYITRQVKTINSFDTKCKTVLNGIDTKSFFHAKAADRTALGIGTNDFLIVYSGRLTPEKGILQLVQAIKRINLPSVMLLIIGASSYGRDKQPTPFIEKLEKESEPIREKVIFTGFIDYTSVPSFLKMGDIAVVPSMWEEPFGLTVVEAMAAGLPLITTRSGGIPEICEGVAVLLDRDNIIDHLTDAITDLYKHPEKRKKMAQTSFEHSKLFDKETYAKNFFDALQGLSR